MIPTIAVFGANPALQKTLFFRPFRPCEVNRAAAMNVYAGGKGTNFCRAAKCFGKTEGLLVQFTGGPNGERVAEILRREGIRAIHVPTAAETRTCVTALDEPAHTMTELIEPSYAATPSECDCAVRLFSETLGPCSAAAITGTLPDGTDPVLYTRIAERVFESKKLLLVDAVKGIDGILNSGGSFFLKINAEELCKITGKETVSEALNEGALRWKTITFAITDGPGRAYFQDRTRRVEYGIPKLDRIVSPLGSGDTASAVFLSGLLAGVPGPDAFRTALAAASANCLNPDAGVFDPADMRRLESGITILGASPV